MLDFSSLTSMESGSDGGCLEVVGKALQVLPVGMNHIIRSQVVHVAHWKLSTV